MKEHEIFQSGAELEFDGIVINDLCEHKIFARIEDGVACCDFQFWDDSHLVNLDKSEIDAMIGFLTFVRSKMGV